jgi:hypothetical protein
MADSQDITAQEIPQGFCQCGCGRKTNLARRTEAGRGWVKGEPLKYILGHVHPPHPQLKGVKVHSAGYVYINAPDHPKAQQGYVFEHILVIEKALGKFLPDGTCPHHVNGKKDDNRPGNLVLCQDLDYHNFIHQRTRAFKACGHATWKKCTYCQQYDTLKNLHIQGKG